jgi:hypothetical protein
LLAVSGGTVVVTPDSQTAFLLTSVGNLSMQLTAGVSLQFVVPLSGGCTCLGKSLEAASSRPTDKEEGFVLLLSSGTSPLIIWSLFGRLLSAIDDD